MALFPLILTTINFKPVRKSPFLTIFWVSFFINLYLAGLLENPTHSELIDRAIIFCPYLVVAGFIPFKVKQLTLFSLFQITLYIFLNQELQPQIFYQELFILFLLITIFILNHYHGHKTLKTWTSLQFEKKKTFKKLIKMEHQYREIYDFGGVARALISEKGEILDINPKWESTFKDFLRLGKNCKALIPYLFETKKEFTRIRNEEGFYLKKDSVKLPHYFFQENKNLIFQLHIWFSPKLSMYFLNFIDTTESVLKEKEVSQKEKLVHLGLSAAGCAHDIFNPLSSIILNLELIEENNDKLKAEYGVNSNFMENSELISKSLESTNAIKTLVERLKSFTKNLESTKVRSNLLETIKFANEIFHLPLKEKVLLEFKGDLETDFFIPDHANNFFQVFLNLFNNSYNALQKKGIKKKIIITITRTGHKIAEVKVLDLGLGISAQKIKNLFDVPFQAKDQSDSGIGLFITKKMVEKVNGTISVDSEEEKYTEVTLTLPFHREQKATNENSIHNEI